MFGLVESTVFWSLARPFFKPGVMPWVNGAIWLAAKGMYGKGLVKEQFFSSYLYIHNLIPNINHVYKPAGLVTCQPLIPRSAGHDAVVKLLGLCQKNGIPSMLAGFKRRRGNDRFLSFALDGYSFSIDIHRSRFSREELARRLAPIYDFVAETGGLIYLAKDDRLPASCFKKLYPHHDRFWEIKERVDPDRLFMSDQARRIFGISG